MKHWFDVIFYPSGMGREVQLGRRDPLSAVSLLLDADVSTYLHFARDSDWPSLETAAAPQPAYAMAGALLLQATGASPVELFRQVIDDSSRDSAERAIAVALLAAFLADSSSESDATASLKSFVDRGVLDGVPLGYVLIHLGLRCIEGGTWDAAFAAMDDAARALRGADRHRGAKEMLSQVNRSNRAVLAQMAQGTFDLTFIRGGRKPLHRIDQLTAAALEDDLDRALNSRFNSLGTTTISFGGASMSAAERCLLGALLRAEALGQFQEIVRARSNLGRYVLVSAVGEKARTPDAGFDLLLRGRAHASLERAVRSYLEEGPIGTVARFVNALSERTWSPTVVQSILKVLTQAGDVLEGDNAKRLVLKLVEDYEHLVRPTALVRTETELFNALASIARVAAKDDQEIVARFCLSVSKDSVDALTLQSVPRVLFAIDWDRQDAVIIDQWIAFISENLRAKNDRKLIAEEAMVALAGVRFDAVLRIARAERSGDVIITVLAIRSDEPGSLTSDEVGSAVETLVAQLQSKRSSAVRGAFSLGSRYDSAALLASILVQRSDAPQTWDELVGFLTDAAVMRADKENALRLICEYVNELPQEVVELLREQFDQLSTEPRHVAFLPASASYNSTILRLGDAIGHRDPRTTLQELLSLIGASDEGVRLHAAVAAASVHQIDENALLTVILLLTRDTSANVRAVAGRALASRRWSESNHEGLVWPRLTELLAGTGRAQVLGVLQGLTAGGVSVASLPRTVVSRIESLAKEHPSWHVRRSSSAILRSSEL